MSNQNNQGARMEVDPQENQFSFAARDLQIKNIFTLAFYVIEKLLNQDMETFLNSNIIDLDMSNQVSGIVTTIYTFLRKSANPDKNKVGDMKADKECKIGTQVHKVAFLATEFTTVHPNVKFDFKLAGPLVDMMTSFKMVWDEVRTSPAKYKVKSGDKTIEKSVSQFGLTNVHLPYLTGMTYKPERRAGLMKTLGPLTTSIILAKDKKLAGKCINALMNSIKFLPMAQSIIDGLILCQEPEKAKGFFRAFGDVLLITGSRNSNKMHFPLFYLLKSQDLDFDFSGKRGFLHYIRNAPKFVWEKKSGGTADHIQQVLFHTIFGTSCEDLGVLSAITNHATWHKRKEMSNVFTKSDQQQKVIITPIKFKYVSKLAASSMVKGVATAQPMLTSKFVMSGSRKRNVSGELISYLETQSMHYNYGNDLTSLANALVRMKEAMLESIKAGKMKDAGTTNWFKVVGDELVEDTTMVAAETGNFYYS